MISLPFVRHPDGSARIDTEIEFPASGRPYWNYPSSWICRSLLPNWLRARASVPANQLPELRHVVSRGMVKGSFQEDAVLPRIIHGGIARLICIGGVLKAVEVAVQELPVGDEVFEAYSLDPPGILLTPELSFNTEGGGIFTCMSEVLSEEDSLLLMSVMRDGHSLSLRVTLDFEDGTESDLLYELEVETVDAA